MVVDPEPTSYADSLRRQARDHQLYGVVAAVGTVASVVAVGSFMAAYQNSLASGDPFMQYVAVVGMVGGSTSTIANTLIASKHAQKAQQIRRESSLEDQVEISLHGPPQ